MEEALRIAGENRGELETVLKHYTVNPADSLKYKAACFLIENMLYHYTVEGKTLSAYYEAIDSINRNIPDSEACKPAYELLYKQLGSPNAGANIKLDVQHISAQYLISHIDHAFRRWQEGKWTKHLSFINFVEDIFTARQFLSQNQLFPEDILESVKEFDNPIIVAFTIRNF